MTRITRNRGERTSKRTYRHPSIYNRTADLKEKKQTRFSWSGFLFLILLFGMSYLIFFSPVFMIKSINISEVKYADKAKIEKSAQDYTKQFLNKNIITLNSKKLISNIKALTEVKDIKIIRKFPNSIFIEVEEREPVFILENSGNTYLIDEGGFAFKISDNKYKDIKIVKDSRGVTVNEDERAFNNNFIIFIKEVMGDFDRLSETKIKNIELINTIDELKITTEAGWYVFLNPEFTASNQLINLSRVIVDAKNKNIKMEYVDLRMENRIFYK